MKKLHLLHEELYPGVDLRIRQLQEAARQCGVDSAVHCSLNTDYSHLPALGGDDFLYNAARGSLTLESLLLNPDVATFYLTNPALNQTNSSTDFTIIHEKHGLRAPRTIHQLTSNRDLLKLYVEYLGGFPLILKSAGSTRGIGTIKIESWQNLISTADYLMTTGTKFILREFIHARSGCRMIVLGEQVIAAADFSLNKEDFRNAVDLSQVHYTLREYPTEARELAVESARLANVAFAGVDLLETQSGEYVLLEANFPCGFSALIDVCSVDIPLLMVQYLLQKSENR